MRTVRFYVSCPVPRLSSSRLCRTSNCKRSIAVAPTGPEQQAQDQSGPRRTRTASKPRIRVVPAGPQLQAVDCSGPRRARTASPGSEWSLPDLQFNCKRYIAVVASDPNSEPRIRPPRQLEGMPGENARCPMECQNRCQNRCQKISEHMSDRIKCKNIICQNVICLEMLCHLE